jgi:hypothetical protein
MSSVFFVTRDYDSTFLYLIILFFILEPIILPWELERDMAFKLNLCTWYAKYVFEESEMWSGHPYRIYYMDFHYTN